MLTPVACFVCVCVCVNVWSRDFPCCLYFRDPKFLLSVAQSRPCFLFPGCLSSVFFVFVSYALFVALDPICQLHDGLRFASHQARMYFYLFIYLLFSLFFYMYPTSALCALCFLFGALVSPHTSFFFFRVFGLRCNFSPLLVSSIVWPLLPFALLRCGFRSGLDPLFKSTRSLRKKNTPSLVEALASSNARLNR
jgi:hypothetical protein